MKWCKSQHDLTICRYPIMPLDWYGYSFVCAAGESESKYPIISLQSRCMMGYAQNVYWSGLNSKMAASRNRVYSQKGLLQESSPSIHTQRILYFLPLYTVPGLPGFNPAFQSAASSAQAQAAALSALRLPGVLPTMQGTPVLLASNLNPEVGHMVCA